MCVVIIGGNAGDGESAECVEARGGEVTGGEDTTAAMFAERPSQQSLPFKYATRIGATGVVGS